MHGGVELSNLALSLALGKILVFKDTCMYVHKLSQMHTHTQDKYLFTWSSKFNTLRSDGIFDWGYMTNRAQTSASLPTESIPTIMEPYKWPIWNTLATLYVTRIDRQLIPIEFVVNMLLMALISIKIHHTHF